jgi:hypothetical protein
MDVPALGREEGAGRRMRGRHKPSDKTLRKRIDMTPRHPLTT